MLCPKHRLSSAGDNCPQCDYELLRAELEVARAETAHVRQVERAATRIAGRATTRAKRFEAKLARLKLSGPAGDWVCPVCDCVIHHQVINVRSGKVGVPRICEVPKCINGCGPMRPVTWKENEARWAKGQEALLLRAERAEAELKALGKACSEMEARNNKAHETMADLRAGLTKAEAERDEAQRRIAEALKIDHDRTYNPGWTICCILRGEKGGG